MNELVTEINNLKKDKNAAPASLDDEKLGTPAPKKNYQQEEDADVKEKNKVKRCGTNLLIIIYRTCFTMMQLSHINRASIRNV